MCDPVTIGIISLGLGGASAVSGYMGQKAEAERARAESEEAVAANKAAVLDAAIMNQHELSLRESEELLASGALLSDLERENQATQSTIVVSAMESGVSGNSLDAVLADAQIQTSRNKVRAEKNTQMRLDQIQREKEGVIVEARNSINTVRPLNVRQPSIITPVLQIAGAAVQTADILRDRQHRARTTGGS